MCFWLGSLSKGCDLCQEDWQSLYSWDLFMHTDMYSLGTSFFWCYFLGGRCQCCSEKGGVADCSTLTCCPSCHLEYLSPELAPYKVQSGSYACIWAVPQSHEVKRWPLPSRSCCCNHWPNVVLKSGAISSQMSQPRGQRLEGVNVSFDNLFQDRWIWKIAEYQGSRECINKPNKGKSVTLEDSHFAERNVFEMVRLQTTSAKLFPILLSAEEHYWMTAWSVSKNPCECQLSTGISKTV